MKACVRPLIAIIFIAGLRQATAQANYTPYAFTNFAGMPGVFGTNDGTGNAYVADTDNYTIRRVTPSGVVTTLAGLAGSPGSADGTGSSARFLNPGGVAVDSAGNVYVADIGNYTIRKVTPVGTNWVVTTLAGFPGILGNADGTGSAARFYNPYCVAVDSAGNVYVTDEGNDTIREVSPVGTHWVVRTLAGLAGSPGTNDGTGSAARFWYPWGVAVDRVGNVYVGDYYNSTIREVTPVGTNWVVTTLAGLAGSPGTNDGTGSAARFLSPSGVAVDSVGNIYVADAGNDTIRAVAPVGTNWVVTTLAGLARSPGSADGIGSAARFNDPNGVAVDSAGYLYVADRWNSRITKGTPNPVNPSIWLGLYAGFTISGAVGKTYGIQYASSLTGTNNWTTITDITLMQPVELWVDTSVNVSGENKRFYRAVSVP
jgi:sugar lactone lactonase YvrE